MFIQYPYAADMQGVRQPYAEVERLCEASPFREMLDAMSSHIPAFKAFGDGPAEPRWGQTMLPSLDGAAIYAAVKMFKPKTIIEIGSGDSTRFLAKAADNAKIICIDPKPRAEIDHLPVQQERRLLREEDADLCAQLEPNDILFIDSSHIMLPGFDVDIEFNRIFPRLKPGVIVHIHDIFLPFDYPTSWRTRNWNEQSALVGWLFGSFEIIYPAQYVIRRHPDLIDAAFAEFPVRKSAGSMWLRRL